MQKKNVVNVLLSATLIVSSLASVTPVFAQGPESESERTESVVTATNALAGNALVVLDKKLQVIATIPTGGTGTGGGLGNQGGIVANDNVLLVVNAGDNTISSFKTSDDHLPQLVGTVSSHGVRPISIALRGNIAYVINAGDNTIAGFTVSRGGSLLFIPGSTKVLSGVAPAQIGFAMFENDDRHEHSARGRSELIVTMKGSNTIEVIPLVNSLPGASVVNTSNGKTPFGFDVRGDTLRVSEAFGGTASALSTYRINVDGTLTVLSGSVDAVGQKAACWVAITRDGKYAYTTNTASNSVSSYRVRRDGSAMLSETIAATTAAGPIDMAIGGRTLNVLTSQGLVSFAIASNGVLTELVTNTATAGANGLVVLGE